MPLHIAAKGHETVYGEIAKGGADMNNAGVNMTTLIRID